uniref:Uncharacterized protein n=1 Tax=Tetranychus urticae TaxID=32264 RepID=T1KIC4_TETUR
MVLSILFSFNIHQPLCKHFSTFIMFTIIGMFYSTDHRLPVQSHRDILPDSVGMVI